VECNEPEQMEDIMTQNPAGRCNGTKADVANPRYSYERKYLPFYTPESFGGGADAAITLLQKSFDFFQTRKEAEEYYPDWGYEMTCGFMAMGFDEKR